MSEHRKAVGKGARRQTIRGRMVRILAVSLALVLILVGAIVAHEVHSYRQSGDTVRTVSLALAVEDLVHQTQRERGLTSGLLGGDARFLQEVANQRTNTDGAMLALNSIVSEGAPGSDQVRSVLSRYSELASTRDAVDAHRADRATTFQFYSEAIAGLNLRLGLDQAGDPQLRRGLQALYYLGDAKEQTAQERGFLNGVFAAGHFGPGEFIHFTDIRAWKQAGLSNFQRDATAEQRAKLDAALRSADAVSASTDEAAALASVAGPLVHPIDPVDWWDRMTAVIDSERVVQKTVGADIQHRAEVLQDGAATMLGAYLLAALLAVAVEILLVITSLRAIVRPLAALSVEADEVAARRLPEAIEAWHKPGNDVEPSAPAPVQVPPNTGAEIASVADALDRLQLTAFELASQQALLRRNTSESLANVGRRIQNLVSRQLDFISEFEREELDPSALANLFELDHLATRMRRNSESLLVLVGETSPRRVAEPISLSDVIRAGLSEVEGYRRVVMRRIDEAMIVGGVAGELAHMVAELVENGLSFSSPDLEVEIYGRRIGARYQLAIVDHGVGMPKDQLELANARLRGEIDFLVAPTRFLGHYVVGKLATKLGIEVELTVSAVTGVMARVLLPQSLLVVPGEKAVVLESRPRHATQPDPAPAIAEKAPAAPDSDVTERPRERTRNGLVKRTKQATPVAPKAEPVGELPDLLPERSPDDVGSMLSAVRSAHQRGRDDHRVVTKS